MGIKPTRGLISTTGVVPACRTGTALSVFALDLADAGAVLRIAAGFDETDPYARPAPPGWDAPDGVGPFRFGVPRTMDLFGDAQNAALFAARWAGSAPRGARRCLWTSNPSPRRPGCCARGPGWRSATPGHRGSSIEQDPAALFEVTQRIIAPATGLRAVDAFKAQYRLAALKRQADALLVGLDAVLTPTAPGPYTIARVAADPIGLNSRLGTYTNFMNLLDLAAVAVPAGFPPMACPSA